jgi:outer membrane protein TolC
LTLYGAIQRGLQTNIGLLTRDTTSRVALAERTRALSALLPQVTGSVAETAEQVNLQTIGFTFKFPPIPGFAGIPQIVGPFSYTEARANVSAKVFDWSAHKNFSAAKDNDESARLSAQDARDLVVQAVTNAYLQIIADASRVDSIQAQVNTAQAVHERAVDQKKAGTSPGIDVLRALVELKTQQQRLLAQRNQFDKDKLSLARAIGLPAGQNFDLADSVPFAPLAGLSQQEALGMALAQRPDYQGAKKLVESAKESVKAARAEWYPTLDFNGYYGAAGETLNNSHGVFSLTGGVNFNIFNGGRIRSDEEQAKANLKQRSDELADLAGQIDFQVRAAFLDIRTAAEQVAVAQENLELANETLVQARDRFAAGVADTIEVVQAQESVAAANDSIISALYSHNTAKVELARSLGMAEQGIKRFIEVK